MNALRAIAGWILFLAMAVIAAFFWHQSDMRGKHIQELNARIIEIESQVNHLTHEIVSITEKITETEAEIQTMHTQGQKPPAETSDTPAIPSTSLP